MTIDKAVIAVSGIEIELNRKNIKNLHLSVCPPDGKVKLSAPLRVSDDNARLAVIRKLSWIRQRQREFQEQARQSQRHFVAGESHYFDGRRYLLEVEHSRRRPGVEILGNGQMLLTTGSNTSTEERSRVVAKFYRNHLKRLCLGLQGRWAEVVGVAPPEVRIQRMKTRWGSCNPDTSRILLNLELAKKPETCVEYIFVHELVHLLERHHSEHFASIMNDVMPDWPKRRDLLNSLPLAYETWDF